MRDPNRIDRVLATVRAYWKAHPDLRLCQLILNATGKVDPFYVEDDKLEEDIRQLWTKDQYRAGTSDEYDAQDQEDARSAFIDSDELFGDKCCDNPDPYNDICADDCNEYDVVICRNCGEHLR